MKCLYLDSDWLWWKSNYWGKAIWPLTYDCICKGLKSLKRKRSATQRMKKEVKFADIPTRCSLFKLCSEVQPHQDSSRSPMEEKEKGKEDAPKWPCGEDKYKVKKASS